MSTVMGGIENKGVALIVESVVMFRFFLFLEFLQGMVNQGQRVCYMYRLFRDWSGFKTTLICGSRYKATESHPPFLTTEDMISVCLRNGK